MRDLTELREDIKRANEQLCKITNQWRKNPTKVNFEKYEMAEIRRDELEERYEALTVGV